MGRHTELSQHVLRSHAVSVPTLALLPIMPWRLPRRVCLAASAGRDSAHLSMYCSFSNSKLSVSALVLPLATRHTLLRRSKCA